MGHTVHPTDSALVFLGHVSTNIILSYRLTFFKLTIFERPFSKGNWSVGCIEM